jgi:hypothetical protein
MALGSFEQSLECSAAAEEPSRPVALATLALAALVQNRPDDAHRLGEEEVAIARSDGNLYELAETLGLASSAIGLTVDEGRAIELADEGLEIAHAIGNDYLLFTLLQSAGIARCRVDPPRAVDAGGR